MNTTQISAAGGGILPTPPRQQQSATTMCHNLRPDRLPTGIPVLQPVAPPAVISDSAWEPLAMIESCGASLVVVADGGILSIIDPETGGLKEIGEYGSECFCALASDNKIAASTDQGIAELNLDELSAADLAEIVDNLWYDWLDCDARYWPEISMIAEEGADCSATVDPRDLSCDYSSVGQPLSDADRRAVTSDLKRAYADVAAQAAAQEAYCAPVLMHYRLVGQDGESLFTSPPVLLGPSDSAALTAPIAITSADRRKLDSYTVDARAWRLRLRCSDAVPPEMAKAVSRIEVLASPQFHPFDPDGEAAINLVRRVGDKTLMRVTMPGADRSVSSGNPGVGESRLRRMMSVMPGTERVVAVVHGPFESGQVIDVAPRLLPAFGSVAGECRALERALGRSPDRVSPTLRRLSWPHAFSAQCGASAAGSVLWGGLTAHRFIGFGAKMFASALGGAGPWHAAVAVKFSSGSEQVVSTSEGMGAAPLKFNPVLSYPSPDAVAMTLIVSAGGDVRRQTVPLTPDESGLWSVYVDSSFAPFRLTDEADTFVVPPESKPTVPMPGYVALASESTPAAATAVAQIGDTKVCSLFAASRSQSSWDFSKVRFTALTSGGVYTVTVTPGTVPRLSANLIDPRGTPGSNAAVRVADKILAILDRSLVEVGVSRCKMLRDLSDIDIGDTSDLNCAFDARHRELWISTSAGSTVISLKDLAAHTRDDTISGRAVGSYAVVGGQLCDLSRDRQVESVYVRWQGRLSAGREYLRPRRLIFDLRSPQISYGELTLHRISLTDAEPSPSLRLTLDGAVGSPVVVPFPTLPLRDIAFSFQARLHPSSTIRALRTL